MSNFNDAVARMSLADLVCPKPGCGAANRPGATIIEVHDGIAVCGVCSHDWRLGSIASFVEPEKRK